MSPKSVIPIMAATAACALGIVPVASASTDVQTASSANWAGYVIGGSSSAKSFKSVSGSWVVPTAKCSNGQGDSSFWVGIGGSGSSDTQGSGGSQALEQDGTEVDCNADGQASYSAWYEMVPSPPVKVNMAVHPGDHITAKVNVDGNNVTMSLSDSTTGGSYDKTFQMSNPDTSSAEWIAEAPSTCSGDLSSCTPLPLADFGTVQFSGASATTTDGHTGTISDSAWSTDAVTLDPSASQSGFGDAQFASYSPSGGATPSSLSSDGSSFSVAWSANGSGATDVSGSGSGATGDPTGGYGAGGGYGYGDGSGYGGGSGYGYGDGSGYGYGYGDGSGYGGDGSGYGYGSGWGGYGGYAGGFGDGGYAYSY